MHVTTDAESWCLNRRKIICCSLTWTIENFTLRDEKTITSSSFSSPEDSTVTWHLHMYPAKPDGTDDIPGHNNNHVAIYLGRNFTSEDDRRDITAKFSVSLALGALAEPTLSVNHTFPQESNKRNGWSRFLSRADVTERTVNEMDHMIVKCKVIYLAPEANIVCGKGDGLTDDCGLPVEDIGFFLYKDDTHCDVTLTTHGRSFKAHKSVLAARSPVFCSMFKHDMQEKELGAVEISDVKPSTLEALLYFMYRGQEPCNLGTIAEQVLVASDKYLLDPLKDMAQVRLCSTLSVENAAKRLVTADKCTSTLLKTKTIDFIIANITLVMQTEGWKNLAQQNFHLMEELFAAMASLEPPAKKSKRD